MALESLSTKANFGLTVRADLQMQEDNPSIMCHVDCSAQVDDTGIPVCQVSDALDLRPPDWTADTGSTS